MTDQGQDGLEAESVRFHDRLQPSIEPGDYRLRVTQSVSALKRGTGDGQRAPFTITDGDTEGYHFTVAAPRLALDPQAIYSIHPAKGQPGDFAGTLPHVVLSEPTLPWTRHLVGPEVKEGTPWLGLIVIGPGDFPANGPTGGSFPKTVIRKVRDLLEPAENDSKTFGPKLGEGKCETWLDAHESLEDLCSTIDLPLETFRRVAPRPDDLALLTHVREVRTDAKETAALLSDGMFSVCVANRMPEPGTDAGTTENRVYLVSFEGLESYFEPAKSEDAPTAQLRLAVLAEWSFSCTQSNGVDAALGNLAPRRLTLPQPKDPETPDDDSHAYVAQAFDKGFAPFNHRTRWGEPTVSWYRGPLCPVQYEKQTDMEFRPTADAALRYSAHDGLFDVSYAAAYQLGRLLAMQDRHFVAAMHAFRVRVRNRANSIIAADRARRFVGATTTAANPRAQFEAYLGTLTKDRLDGPQESTDAGPSVDPRTTERVGELGVAIPAAVVRWLSRILLLYRLPFHYLVPDQRMLPPNAMAFFALDPNWMKCLLEGACSVGRLSGHDLIVERALRTKFLDFALEHAGALREKKLAPGAPDATEDRPVDHVAKPPNWPLTGFILRSPLVGAWQGIEMRAWQRENGQQVPLKPLRIDRLSPEIMLCLFDGAVDEIEIKQPPEGQYFGLSPDSTENGLAYKKQTLRRLARDDQNCAGSVINITKAITAPLRGNASRVLDVVELANSLAKKLPVTSEIGSAGFAVQMIESAKLLRIKKDERAAQ